MDQSVGQAFQGLAAAMFPNPASLAQAAELKSRRELLNEQTRATRLKGDALGTQNDAYNALADLLSAGGNINAPGAVGDAVRSRNVQLLKSLPGAFTTANPGYYDDNTLSKVLTANGTPFQNTPAGVDVAQQGLANRAQITANARQQKAGSVAAVPPKTFAQLATILSSGLNGDNPGATIAPDVQAQALQTMADEYQRTKNTASALAAAKAKLQFTPGAQHDSWTSLSDWFTGPEPGQWALKDAGSAVPLDPNSTSPDPTTNPNAGSKPAPAKPRTGFETPASTGKIESAPLPDIGTLPTTNIAEGSRARNKATGKVEAVYQNGKWVPVK